MKFVSKLSKDSLICNELQVKHYKEIIKCSIGDEPDVVIFVETFCAVLADITSKPIHYIKSLSIIDILCLLLDIRYNSLGVCKLVVTQDDKKINLELNLELAKKNISNLFNSLTQKVTFNDIEIVLTVPSLARLYEPFNEDYVPYITECTFTKVKTFQIDSNEQADKMFNLLPPKLSLQLIDKFNRLIQEICSVDLLKQYNIPNQRLIVLPTLPFLIWFTKLLFGENLASFYDNLFSLSFSGKMNAEYIENLPIGEYNYFIGLLKQTMAPKDSGNGDIPNMNQMSGDSLEEMM